jgi:hypothetical protein
MIDILNIIAAFFGYLFLGAFMVAAVGDMYYTIKDDNAKKKAAADAEKDRNKWM